MAANILEVFTFCVFHGYGNVLETKRVLLVPATQNTGGLLDFFSVNCEQTSDEGYLHCIDQLLKLYFSVWMLRLRQRFIDYDVVYQLSVKLNNKPFPRQVTSCLTLDQN